ncbi:MAG: NADH:ubiquinone oxidoreductase [Rhodobacteraceae bacterium]|nr:NADH:ubiquinone oxidoreductase [Paracoccaceae bacterium]
MTQTTNSTCRNVCWILGIIGGVIAFLLLKGAMAMLLALILAVVVALCLGFLLVKIFCTKDEAASAVPPTATQAAPMAKIKPAPVPREPETAEPEAAPEPEVEAAPEPVSEPVAVAAPIADVPTAPDDLKKLKGVGPKIEEKLHAAGVTTFAQIAAWGAEDIAKMDDLLAFKGRIDRDGWVAQAKTLAAGGLTEFAKRVDDGDVY